MTTDFFEYYFLASCYEQGVSEDTVYKLFIEKIIADYVYPKFPYIISISSFQKYIVDKYKIEILVLIFLSQPTEFTEKTLHY